ncbi:FAD-binding oxidoreductase [Kineosporia sp. NBRC 101677]|uniref:NAD(P)/FAD-dependent oxidoreductase n=1 Tax=Kineosporia sp. NBRC 101677 TaxID=3032197 RepID=UPI002557A496|nr:FAD-binding oxidoreductase [Kineosporia sp. NBRC 101677]
MTISPPRSARPLPPVEADVVVIGGGVMGLSTAYHLAAAGVDVVLLEGRQLGSGSTGKAAGGLRTLFADEVDVRLAQHGREALHRFGRDLGKDVELQVSGHLFLLDDAADVAAFEAAVKVQNSLGGKSRMIDAEEARRLAPLISTEGLLAAAYSPEDGYCSPEAVVAGYTGAARKLGVEILTGTPATGIHVENGRIQAVLSPAGRIATSTVICTAGAWSGRIGEWAGVELPVRPLRVPTALSTPVPDLPAGLPFTVDLGTSFAFRPEGSGLLLSAAEQQESWAFDQNPAESWLDDLARAMAVRVPGLGEVGVRHSQAGLHEMTPDRNALIGEAADVSRFLYCTGFSGQGLAMAPAAGEVMRDLYLGATATVEVGSRSAERFGARPSYELPAINTK